MKPKIKKLKNGMRLLLVPMKDQMTATVFVLVEAGSKYETKDKNGISHFLEHMCFKGTATRPNQMIISHELDALGAEYNAFTMHEATGYYAKVSSRHIAQAIDLVSDIYMNPLFKSEDIEREKGVIQGEIDMRNDMLRNRVGELFMELLYGDQPAGWPIAGPKELIPTLTREDFIQYRDAHYVARTTTVVVAGKFDSRKVTKLIETKFANISKRKSTPKAAVIDAQHEPKVLLKYKECDQTHLVIGVRSFGIFHPSYPTLSVLAGVLGVGMSSRLFHKVREELGAGYYVNAGNDAYTDHGMFVASAGAEHGKVGIVVEAILKEFKRLKTELVSKEELKKVKEMLAGRLVLGLESSDELGEFYGFQEVLKGKFIDPNEAIARINKVTAKDIQKIAQKLFVPERLNLAMIGPWKDPSEFQKLLKL